MHGKVFMGKLQRALGLMSGTSMDGIDVALLDTDGDRDLRHGPAASYPYPADIRVKLRAALARRRRCASAARGPAASATSSGR